MKELSNTEFEIMKVVWENEPPITSNIIMEHLGNEKQWKLATILTLLNRLVKKGFLKTEKLSKERLYYPIVERDKYLAIETSKFMKNYHNNSLKSFVDILFLNDNTNKKEIESLMEFLERNTKRGD